MPLPAGPCGRRSARRRRGSRSSPSRSPRRSPRLRSSRSVPSPVHLAFASLPPEKTRAIEPRGPRKPRGQPTNEPDTRRNAAIPIRSAFSFRFHLQDGEERLLRDLHRAHLLHALLAGLLLLEELPL